MHPRSAPPADEVGAGEAGAFRLSRLASVVKERGPGPPELPDGLAERSTIAMERSFAAMERSAAAAERSFAALDRPFTTKE